MGYLSEGGGSSSEGSAEPVAAESAPVESAAPETAAAPEAVDPSITAEPTRTERVAVGRRGKAAAQTSALETQMRTLNETIARQSQETAQAIAQRDQELARLRGGFEAIQPFLQQRNQAPAAPTPEALFAEAQKLLDDGKFGEYQRKFAEAVRTDVLAQIPKPQAAQPQQQGPNPIVGAMLNQFPTVLNAGERGMQLAIIKDQELAVMGFPNGYERYRKAFELASNQLAPQQGAQYSQGSRQVLSGTPPARGAGGGSRGEGVTLNEVELKWYEAVSDVMTKEEYAKSIADAHPERLER